MENPIILAVRYHKRYRQNKELDPRETKYLNKNDDERKNNACLKILV